MAEHATDPVPAITDEMVEAAKATVHATPLIAGTHDDRLRALIRVILSGALAGRTVVETDWLRRKLEMAVGIVAAAESQMADLRRHLSTLLLPAESGQDGAGRACCDLHNVHCEPPSELCCESCTEGRHPEHPAGVRCVLESSGDGGS